MSEVTDIRETLFLISKFLQWAGGFEGTVAELERESALVGRLGQVHNWDGTARTATLSDWRIKYPDVPPTQLLDLQRLAIDAVSNFVGEGLSLQYSGIVSSLQPLSRGSTDNKSTDTGHDSKLSAKCPRLLSISNREYGASYCKILHRASISNYFEQSVDDVPNLAAFAGSGAGRRVLALNRMDRLWSSSGHMRFPVYCVSFSTCGNYVLTGGDDYLVKCWEIRSGRLLYTCRGHIGEISIIAITSDNSYFATACTAGVIRVWRLSDGVCARVFKHRKVVNWMSFDTVAGVLVSVGDDGACIVWDLVTLLYNDVYDGTGSNLLDKLGYCAPEIESEETAAGSNIHSRCITQWDENVHDTNEYVVGRIGEYGCLVLPHNSSFFSRLRVQQGHTLGTAATSTPHHLLSTPESELLVNCVTLHPAAGIIVTGSSDGIGRVWEYYSKAKDTAHNANSGVRRSGRRQGSGITGRSEVATLQALSESEMFLCERIRSRLLNRLEGHMNAITDIRFSNVGDRLVTGSTLDCSVRIWSFSSGFTQAEQVIISVLDASEVSSASANVTSSLLNSGPSRKLNRRKPVPELHNVCWTCNDEYVITIHSYTFSPPTQTTESLSVNTSSKLRVWHPWTGRLCYSIECASSQICKVLVPHPSEPTLVLTAGVEGVLKVWDWSLGVCLVKHEVTGAAPVADYNTTSTAPADMQCVHILDAAFSPDGSYIATTDILGQISVFGLGDRDIFKSTLKEQYFSTDYAEVIHDENGFAVDLGTQLPVSEAPRGPLCLENGTPVDPQPEAIPLPSCFDSDFAENFLESQFSLQCEASGQFEKSFAYMVRQKQRHSQNSSGNHGVRFGANVHGLRDSKQNAVYNPFFDPGSDHHNETIVEICDEGSECSFEYISDSDNNTRNFSRWRRQNLIDPDGRRNRRSSILQIQNEARNRRRTNRERKRRRDLRSSNDESDDSNDSFCSDGDSTNEGVSNDYGLRSSQRRKAYQHNLKSAKKRSSLKRRRLVDSDDNDHFSNSNDENEAFGDGDDDTHKRRERAPRSPKSFNQRRKSAVKPKPNGRGWTNLAGHIVIPIGTSIDRSWLMSAAPLVSVPSDSIASSSLPASALSSAYQYSPQIGDDVFYFAQGHMEHLQAFPEETSPPWVDFPQKWPIVGCKVVGLRYQFPTWADYKHCPSVVVYVTLAVTLHPILKRLSNAVTFPFQTEFGEARPSSYTCNEQDTESNTSSSIASKYTSGGYITFTVSIRNCNLPEFVVPAYAIQRCMRTPYRRGMVISAAFKEPVDTATQPNSTVNVDHSEDDDEDDDMRSVSDLEPSAAFKLVQYHGTVVKISAVSPSLWPNSPWEAVEVHWQSNASSSDTTNSTIGAAIPTNSVPNLDEDNQWDRINPWEATSLLDPESVLAQGIARIVPPRFSRESVEALLKQIGTIMLSRPDEYSAFEFAVDGSLFPDYYAIVPVPVYVDLIKFRLGRGYYRQVSGLLAEIELIRHNCELYNAEEAPIRNWANDLVQELRLAVLSCVQDEQSDQQVSSMIVASQTSDSAGETVSIPSEVTNVRTSSRLQQRHTSPSDPARSREMMAASFNSRLVSIESSNSTEIAAPAIELPSLRISGSMLGITGESLAPVSSAPTQRATVVQSVVTRRLDPELKSHMLQLVEAFENADPNHFFAEPVTEAIAPGYFEVVFQPMDTSTIRSKIAKRQYVELIDVYKDCMLILCNCISYNEPESGICALALQIRCMLAEHEPTLWSQYIASEASSLSSIWNSIERFSARMKKSSSSVTRRSTRNSSTASFNSDKYESLSDNESDESNDNQSDTSSKNDEIDSDDSSNSATPSRPSRVRRSGRSQRPRDAPSSPIASGRRSAKRVEPQSPKSNRISVGSGKSQLASVSRSRRLDPELKSRMLQLVEAVENVDIDQLFSEPVTEDIAPGYFSIIMNPMDISTIRRKISERVYFALDEVKDDVLLILDNCELYNDPDSDICALATKIRKVVLKKFNQLS